MCHFTKGFKLNLMSVSEYSKAKQVSVQSVYQRIKSGKLEWELKDGIKYIKVKDEEEYKEKGQGMQADCKEIVKVYKRLVKDLRKQIKRLEKGKDKNYEQLEKLFNISLQSKGFTPLLEANVIDVNPKKSKKEKSKKKNKKK